MQAPERIRQRLLGRTAARLARLGRDKERDRSEPPRPGDLFVFRETAELDLQWAVVEHRHARGLRVVPADMNPILGRADVSVAADSSCGALTLRCGYGTWLGGERFDPRLRTGSVPPGPIARVRSKLSRIDRSAGGGRLSGRGSDDDPEYRRWIGEVVERALAQLAPA